ncbi:hypothetical protein GCM10023203_00980 [Actinomycetospora straminea]|uniref:Uncharacterized protein n=1 Tax=Actinomycetospora straminea TaxID=663607 RepID=A0ABP9DUV4_9PSEU
MSAAVQSGVSVPGAVARPAATPTRPAEAPTADICSTDRRVNLRRPVPLGGASPASSVGAATWTIPSALGRVPSTLARRRGDDHGLPIRGSAVRPAGRRAP